MSKIVYLCLRNRADKSVTQGDFNILSERLIPDNIPANPPLVIEQDGILIGVLNPNSSLHIKDTSICTGHMINPSPKWGEPLSPIPDGAYAMFRGDDNTVEIATDIVASRTIWYAQNENLFIASTSQRAIVFFLESFEPNNAAFLWMLSSGSLGLENSWDRRIKFLTPDTRLRLDRSLWKVTVEDREVDFHCTGRSEQEYERDLRDALEYSFSGLSLDYSKWVLPLSGGYDSREILLKLKDRQNLQIITWGMRSDQSDKDSDAYIARQVAEHFGLPFRYLELDPSNELLENVFGRFISAGEGRTDNIAHFLDGFNMWRSLIDSKFEGIIKGDEAFGWFPVTSDAQVRYSVRAHMLKDFKNMHIVKQLAERQFGVQILPDKLKRRDGHTIDTFRDHIYHTIFPSIHLASWNESRRSYVEVVQPYLSRRIINTVRTMPDSLRTQKFLFKKIVASESPSIPFAPKRGSAYTQVDIFRTPDFIALVSETLNSSYYRGLFSSALMDNILGKLKLAASTTNTQRLSLKQVVKFLLPTQVKLFLTGHIINPDLSYGRLAFRTYLAGKANEMFSADANQRVIQRSRLPLSINEEN